MMMTQLGKRLLCEPKDLSSNPQIPYKGWARHCMSSLAGAATAGALGLPGQ